MVFHIRNFRAFYKPPKGVKKEEESQEVKMTSHRGCMSQVYDTLCIEKRIFWRFSVEKNLFEISIFGDFSHRCPVPKATEQCRRTALGTSRQPNADRNGWNFIKFTNCMH